MRLIISYDTHNVNPRIIIILFEVDRSFGLIEYPQDTRYGDCIIFVKGLLDTILTQSKNLFHSL